MKYPAFLLLILLTLTGVARAEGRILSLDYCADQYVLALADRDDILALSPAAMSEYAYLSAEAAGLPRMRPTGEQILLSHPSLVVRQWGGGYDAPAHLARFGVPVVEVADGGDFATMRHNLRAVGQALGAQSAAEAMIAAFDARLQAIEAQRLPPARQPRALYLTRGGATAGAGTFVDRLLRAAGVRNMAAQDGARGWRAIDLEAIALDPPDMIIAAFFDLKGAEVYYWSAGRHGFLEALMRRLPTVAVPSAQVACAGWFSLDAVQAIQATAKSIAAPVMANRR